jgi:hypothetical protein
MRLPKYWLLVCLLLAFCSAGQADSLYDNVEIRPDIGYGYAVSKDHERGMGYHAGVRILTDVRNLSSPEPQKRAGISITEVSPFESKTGLRHKKYLALGIMLEQMLASDFVITIGTIGYIGQDQNKNNPFGLLAEFGWEPKLGKNTQGFVALRAESIYDTSTISRYALSAGVKYTLF